jgi:hypothetical protein
MWEPRAWFVAPIKVGIAPRRGDGRVKAASNGQVGIGLEDPVGVRSGYGWPLCVVFDTGSGVCAWTKKEIQQSGKNGNGKQKRYTARSAHPRHEYHTTMETSTHRLCARAQGGRRVAGRRRGLRGARSVSGVHWGTCETETGIMCACKRASERGVY